MEDDELRALEAWLAHRLPDGRGLRVHDAGKPAGGFSAETIIVDATWDGGGNRFVLRKETPDPPVYPTQVPGLTTEVEIQYRVMNTLTGHGIPLAPLVGYEADTAVLGTEFFVMGFVDGVVPIENPLYTREGFFTELRPEQRTAMIDDGINQLVAIHAVDPKLSAFLLPDGVEPTTRRQFDLWHDYMVRELGGRTHPVYDTAYAWLVANLPSETEPVLCWGDARMGNIIWRDDKAACLTDFEAAAIAPPEMDLGWWLMFDRWSHESFGAPRLDGEPTREEQRARYEKLSGRSVGDTTWFEVFAAARYTAIVVRVMNRLVARGDLPADQTIWLENPATDCLQQLIEEHGL
jgi:aminoglycoside phosphotransferase (APT) family kinase protein